MIALPGEYNFTSDIKRGTKSKQVGLVQEWLSLNGTGTGIDNAFGSGTEAAVKAFQQKKKLPTTGIVDQVTFETLTAPIRTALKPIAAGQKTMGQLVAAYAEQHLKQHPREVGGQNSGPWVRLYTKGKQGAAYPWCAAFVSVVLAQAADTLGTKPPVAYTLGCDQLANSAKKIGRFVAGKDIAAGKASNDILKPCAIFLVRKKPGDWTHTGFATAFDSEHFETIEGNTNDSGDREGYEVCKRMRSYDKKDFVVIG